MIFVNKKMYLKELKALLAKRIRSNGFIKSGQLEWNRKFTWKTDQIDIRIRGAYTLDINIGLRIFIPFHGERDSEEWPFQYLTQVNVGAYCGRKDVYYKVPSLKFSEKKSMENILSDFDQSMKWFEKYSTPEECLNDLSNLLKVDSIAYKDAFKTLNEFKSIE